jgi:ribosomal protein S18 acetylase RimI-like enzyme
MEAADMTRARRAGREDLDELAALFDAYRVFYDQPSQPERARAFVRERIEQGDSAIFVVEGEGGELQGFTQLYPSLSSVSMARIYVLNDLFVAPEARRGGVARALMQAAHDFARQSGAVRVSLATATDNVSAQPLYESMGYRRDEAFFHYDLALVRPGS